MSARKVCINHPQSYYTGKEQSPLHFGLSAEGYDINSIMEGFDKELWIVEVRNNKKVWTKKEHINKMTYEIPLITEFTEDLRECKSSSVVSIDFPSVIVSDISVVTSLAVDVPSIVSSVAIDVPSNTGEAVCDSASTIKEKISKTVKPTDYTLFITYRIHQMKEECTDNKKNYDCARYEWKEYKNKPEELRLIMIAARQGIANDFKKPTAN